MAYEKLGAAGLDYRPCRYAGSKLLFRGPRRQLDGDYVVFLGGTETYGKFIAEPFPALAEAQTGVTCVNLGWPNAGADVYLNDPGVLAAARAARGAVLQVPCAQNMSNRFYRVHPRRNDRFVQASAVLRALYPDVDFTEFHFTRHLLIRLQQISSERFALACDELRTAWVARMRQLLGQLECPVVLLWFSARQPGESDSTPDLSADPAFVSRAMIEDVREAATELVEVCASRDALAAGTEGMVYATLEAPAAAELLGPAAHEEAAAALAPVLGALAGA